MDVLGWRRSPACRGDSEDAGWTWEGLLGLARDEQLMVRSESWAWSLDVMREVVGSYDWPRASHSEVGGGGG